MIIKYTGWRRSHGSHIMIAKDFYEDDIIRQNLSGRFHADTLYLEEKENIASKLIFFAPIRASGDYLVEVEFTVEELLIMLKSHIKALTAMELIKTLHDWWVHK